MKKMKYSILEGKIFGTLIKMTIPSLAGMFGMMIFNITDTYFVGQLGTLELAAISFTFPVVMILNSIVFGIGVAAMTLFSKAAGQKNIEKERLLATSSLTLGISLSLLMGIAGYFTTDQLFSLLGADEKLLNYIRDYMYIWYMGAGFMVIPMLGDSILRGLGDTLTPALVMLVTALLNIFMDPLLIFGIGPFPEMGVKGAALATIISRGIAALISILIQIFRENLLTFKGLGIRKIMNQWKELFHIGLPNSLVKAITPLGTAVFTSILARFGHEIVAGYGVATKIESVFLSIVNASTITTTVFIGQNMGSGKKKRARKGIRIIYMSLMGMGFLIAGIFFFSGNFLAGLFNDDPLVRKSTASYLKIVPIGYAFLGLTQAAASILNVFHKPYLGGGLSLFQIVLIAVPVSFILSALLGAEGVFVAITCSFVITGIISSLIVRKQSKINLEI